MKLSLDFHQTLNFLGDLREHNSKDWFDQNRPAYDTARETFAGLIDYLIDEFRTSDNLQNLSARECITRIYRDIRFSKDKSPYHTNFSAIIAPGGKKSLSQGYYISIQPQGHSLVAGGLHMPDPQQLYKFRQAVARDASAFKAITGNKIFIDQFGKIEGERLKTAPKGYDRDHPEIELLRLKDVTALQYFPDREVQAGDFPERVVTACRALKPFLVYLDEILQ